MASIEDILACLGEPEVAQFPDFTQAIRELVDDRNEMVKALRPFAEVYRHDIGTDETDADLFQVNNNNRAPKLTVGDFKRAFQASYTEE